MSWNWSSVCPDFEASPASMLNDGQQLVYTKVCQVAFWTLDFCSRYRISTSPVFMEVNSRTSKLLSNGRSRFIHQVGLHMSNIVDYNWEQLTVNNDTLSKLQADNSIPAILARQAIKWDWVVIFLIHQHDAEYENTLKLKTISVLRASQLIQMPEQITRTDIAP